MQKILIILFIFLIPIIALPQKRIDATITGMVYNKKTKEEIPFLNIAVKGTIIGISTNNKGQYVLKNLPIGVNVIIASGIGYKTIEKSVFLLAGESLEINFEIEEDVIQLDDVVVSANRNEINRKEAPVVINVIHPKLLESTNSVCLAQGLNFQLGLRVENNCQNCGFQQVKINGLDGPYSQILIDSRPVFSSLASVYGIEQIPANMIERVEIMRGGGSALFGSNAIAGTINIITKEPVNNSIQLANTTNIIGGNTMDYNTFLNASVVSEEQNVGAVLFSSLRNRQPFDYDKDGFTELGIVRLKTLGFRSFYKPGKYSKLSIEYHNMNEYRRGGNYFNLPPHETDITEQTEHGINTGGIKYNWLSKNTKYQFNLFSSAQHINRKSYYGAQKDMFAYGTTKDVSLSTGLQYTHRIDTLLFLPAEFTLGIEHLLNEMDDKMLGYQRHIEQNIYTSSAFMQNEWKSKKYSILIGGRVDKHNLILQPIISPRINLRYAPKDWINMRISYATGFRAPQAFDEDLHITAVGGEVTIIRLDPDLKTETFQSYSGSIELYKNFGSVLTTLLIEPFYTRLDNVFVLEEVGSDNNGNLILERRNGKGAIVQGINFETKIVPFQKIQLQAGYTFQKNEYMEPQQWSDNTALQPSKRMYRAPNHYGYFTTNYQILKNTSVSTSGVYTGTMWVQHFAGYVAEDVEKQTPDFFDLNIKLMKDFYLTKSTKMQVNAGMQNILNSYQSDFDKGQYRDAGYLYGPSLPRTFFFGLKLSI